MAIPKADRQLEPHTSEVLAPGEHVVAATRALAVGAFEGRLGIVGELLTGALMQSLLTGESVRRAHRAGFPAAPRMVIGLTERRLLVWRAALFSHKPVRFLGDVPLERVSSVSVQPAVDRRRVTFGFADAAPVSVTAYKRDHPERFAENFQRPHVAASVGVALLEAEERVQQPGSIDLPVVPAPSMAMASTLTMGASAAGPGAQPPFPPPPPVTPARPARPAARSWATSMPVAQSAAPGSPESQPSDQKKCIQCGTVNPGSALFCYRCYVPFAEQQNVVRPVAPPLTQSSPAPVRIPGALDSAVKPTLSWAAVPAPIKTKYRSAMVTKVAIAVMVALVAFGAYGGARDAWARYTRKHVVVPASIAGMGKIDDPSLQRYVGQLETLAQQNGITGKAAFYGFSGSPRFYFAAFEYQKGPNQSADDIFSDFARGYASAGKAKIDMATKAVDASEEATIICARIRGGVRGSLCMWTDRDTVGFVQTIRQDIRPSHDLAAVVRFSVES